MNVQDVEKSLAERLLSKGEMLEEFMPITQRFALKHSLNGEEGKAVARLVLRIAERIRFMPGTRRTGHPRKETIAHLHYFRPGIEAWIAEKDAGGLRPDETQQLRALGRISIAGCANDPEVRHVSIKKLIENNVELDLFWEPRALKDC